MALLALTAGAELWLRHVAPQRDAVAAVIVAAHGSGSAGIILGHSHTYALGAQLAGYDNLSLPGANIPMMRALAALRSGATPPRYTIVAAGPELLSVANLARGDGGLDDAAGSGPLYLLKASLARRLLPSLLRPAAGAEAEMQALGVGERWDQVDPVRRDIWTRARVEQQRPAPHPERTAHLAELAAMLDALTASGTHVCLVRTPVTPAYLEAAAAFPEFAAAATELRALATAPQRRWVDFRDIEPPLALAEFLNQDHVNAMGAARFGPWLQRRCEDTLP